MKTKARAVRPQKTPLQSAVIFYLIGVMLGLPLIFTDGYFNITETKSIFFHIISIILIAYTISGSSKKSPPSSEGPLQRIKQLSVSDKAMAFFCATLLVSCVLSKYSDCWLGLSSRYQGFYTVLVYTVIYFIISKNFTSAQGFLFFSVFL